MKPIARKKLHFHPETIRTLTTKQVAQVEGGFCTITQTLTLTETFTVSFLICPG